MEDNNTIHLEHMGGGRKEIIHKDEYYMSLALLTSSQSEDPSTQVGACIVDTNGEIISTGYNHPPRGWESRRFPWGNDLNNGKKNTKYPYIIHAEMDACARHNCEGATCYVTLFPCTNCAKLLVESGVKKVVYLHMYTNDPEELACVMDIFRNSEVEFISYSELKELGFDGLDINVDTKTKDNVKIRKRSVVKLPKNIKEYV